MSGIDIDAILAQREEATGSADQFTFSFKGQEWTCTDPITATDEFKDALMDLETDIEVAEHYMGTGQYEKFVAAGGRAGFVMLALQQYTKQMRAEATDGRPTRPSNSSGKRRKR